MRVCLVIKYWLLLLSYLGYVIYKLELYCLDHLGKITGYSFDSMFKHLALIKLKKKIEFLFLQSAALV